MACLVHACMHGNTILLHAPFSLTQKHLQSFYLSCRFFNFTNNRVWGIKPSHLAFFLGLGFLFVCFVTNIGVPSWLHKLSGLSHSENEWIFVRAFWGIFVWGHHSHFSLKIWWYVYVCDNSLKISVGLLLPRSIWFWPWTKHVAMRAIFFMCIDCKHMLMQALFFIGLRLHWLPDELFVRNRRLFVLGIHAIMLKLEWAGIFPIARDTNGRDKFIHTQNRTSLSPLVNIIQFGWMLILAPSSIKCYILKEWFTSCIAISALEPLGVVTLNYSS